MKIKKMELLNIGPYVGQSEIDFSTTREKNIILIGGKNGAGKTTILKAIKIGLYGCFAYGYKTENMSYLKEVEGMFSYYATSNEYSIKITLEFVEKLIKNEYVILRKWIKCHENIIETVSVIKDGIGLDEANSLEFVSKLRAVSSPELINSFIFDGETIGGIIDSNKTSSYIRNTFNSVFNIDILNQFREDLTTYLGGEKDKRDTGIEYELTTLLLDINSKKAALMLVKERHKRIVAEIQDVKLRLEALQNEFVKLGGIPKEQADKLKAEIRGLERASEENNKILREFYEDYLPYCIVLDELRAISNRSKKELPLIYAFMLQQVQEYMHEDLSSYIFRLHSDVKEMLFGLKEDEIQIIDSLIKITNEKKSNAVSILTDKNYLISSMIDMRARLENSCSVARLDEIIIEVKTLMNTLCALKNSEIETYGQIDDLERELNVIIKKYGEMFEASKRNKTVSKSYLICANSISVIDNLIEHIKNDKLKALSATTCRIFNDTIRKKDYITDIIIDNEFELHLFVGSKQFDVSALSAGERQLLVSCIIWAMFKVSGRREMFVFDTPLARLDAETRALFITKIMSNISEQVLILSTDSEFVGDNFDLIFDHVARMYLLCYNDVTNTTEIKQRYF